MNSIVLVGRLTRDPELRYVASGDPVANFAIAVERPFKNTEGEREVDFIDIVAWRKGHLVGVRGRLQIRSYQAQDGQKRKVAEVVADMVRFLGAPRNAVSGSVDTPESPAAVAGDLDGGASEPALASEDVPF
jgi:single-strand DNA-binding protein